MNEKEIHQQGHKKIGLIGGMGSDATIETYRKIMKFAHHDMRDLSPHLIINNLPRENIFDRLEESLATMICHGIEDLSRAGASVIGMSCNTAHIYINSIKAEAARRQIKFINMISCVVEHCQREGYRRIGILATPDGCEIYRQEIDAGKMIGIAPSPEQQLDINNIIRVVLEGHAGQIHRDCLNQFKNNMFEEGCDTVILGCTELPLVFGECVPAGYICSISILAKNLLWAAYPAATPVN